MENTLHVIYRNIVLVLNIQTFCELFLSYLFKFSLVVAVIRLKFRFWELRHIWKHRPSFKWSIFMLLDYLACLSDTKLLSNFNRAFLCLDRQILCLDVRAYEDRTLLSFNLAWISPHSPGPYRGIFTRSYKSCSMAQELWVTWINPLDRSNHLNVQIEILWYPCENLCWHILSHYLYIFLQYGLRELSLSLAIFNWGLRPFTLVLHKQSFVLIDALVPTQIIVLNWGLYLIMNITIFLLLKSCVMGEIVPRSCVIDIHLW